MDIKDKARQQWNGLERILHAIPGFKGYYEKELRRDADRVQREFIVTRLRQVKSGMNKMLQAAARAKDFDRLREYDLFVKELDKNIGAVRYADGGYSGFFDLLKIREAELDRAYDHDALIVEAVVSFAAEFKKLAAAPAEPAGLASLREQLERIAGLCAQRTELLKGYGQGEGK